MEHGKAHRAVRTQGRSHDRSRGRRPEMGRGERLGAVAVACTAHALRGSSRADVWQGRRGGTEVISLSGALREATLRH